MNVLSFEEVTRVCFVKEPDTTADTVWYTVTKLQRLYFLDLYLNHKMIVSSHTVLKRLPLTSIIINSNTDHPDF